MKKEYASTKITHLLKERKWTLYRLAKESGVQNSNLKNICFHNRIPTIPTIIKICNGFGITLSEFFHEESTAFNYLTISEQQLLAYFHNMTGKDKKLAADYVHRLSKHVPNTVDHTPLPENTGNQKPGLGIKSAANNSRR